MLHYQRVNYIQGLRQRLAARIKARPSWHARGKKRHYAPRASALAERIAYRGLQ